MTESTILFLFHFSSVITVLRLISAWSPQTIPGSYHSVCVLEDKEIHCIYILNVFSPLPIIQTLFTITTTNKYMYDVQRIPMGTQTIHQQATVFN